MQADLVVDLLDLRARRWRASAGLRVVGVLEGHDGVQAVVAAGQLDDDEDGVLAARLVRRSGRRRRRGSGTPGTFRPQATTPAEVSFRKSRRFGDMDAPLAEMRDVAHDSPVTGSGSIRSP